MPRDKTEVGLSQLAANSRTRVGALLGTIAILFSILFGAAPAMAQPHLAASTGFSIGGVISNDGTPVAGVVLSTSLDGKVYTSTTDASGQWLINVPKATIYKVTLDVKTLPKGVNLREGTTATKEVDLTTSNDAGLLFPLGANTHTEQSFSDQFLVHLVAGLNLGLVLALAAIGISLIFGTTGLSNFAHGDMVSFGALFAWLFSVALGWPLILAAIVSIALTALAGWLQDAVIWKPLRKKRVGINQMMIVSIGFSIVFRYLLLIFFDGDTKSFAATGQDFTFGPVIISSTSATSMILCAVALAGVALFLTKTRIGKATRAVSDNPSLAASTGIDVERIIRIVWVFAAALTGLAGILYGLQFQANWLTGFDILLLLFASVTLGGLGTALGAAVGALIIGLVVDLSSLVLPTDMNYASALVVLILVLLIRPQGVLGKKQRIG